MRADNTRHLIEAARNRRETTLARAKHALERAAASGEPISVSALAAQAGVSRSWLYAEPSLRDQLQSLPRDPRRASPPRPTATHPASDASLRTRLDVALERNKRLAKDNERLRDQLAHALGEQRHTRVTGTRRDERTGPHISE